MAWCLVKPCLPAPPAIGVEVVILAGLIHVIEHQPAGTEPAFRKCIGAIIGGGEINAGADRLAGGGIEDAYVQLGPGAL